MKKLGFTVLFALVGTFAACGSADDAACNDYSDHVAGLACLDTGGEGEGEGEGEVVDICEEQPEGCETYWTCLKDNAKCDGDTPDFAGQAECEDPSDCATNNL